MTCGLNGMDVLSCLDLYCLVFLSWLSFLCLMWIAGCVLSASEGCDMCVMHVCVTLCVLVVCVLKKNILCYFSPFSIHNRVLMFIHMKLCTWIDWMMWRGLVDRPFFLYTCFLSRTQTQVQGSRNGKKKKKKISQVS